jgi:RimJ/RimL family protein N-acetyltransferase
LTELETERLRLRLWQDDDLDTLARWNADPFVMRHMGRAPMTRSESEAQFARFRGHWDEHGFGVWAAELRATGDLVGRIGLSFHSEWPEDPELGWLVDPDHVGCGLATEGGRASATYAFGTLGVPRLVSICTPENVESRRVMVKLGFRLHDEREHATLGILLWIHSLDRLREH